MPDADKGKGVKFEPDNTDIELEVQDYASQDAKGVSASAPPKGAHQQPQQPSRSQAPPTSSSGESEPPKRGSPTHPYRNSLNKHSLELPIEVNTEVPEHLIAEFVTVRPKAGQSSRWFAFGEDNFNDLNKQIRRDNTNRVSSNTELIKAVNDYDYGPSRLFFILGTVVNVASLGVRKVLIRRIVPSGFMGHYISSGRHMLLPSGIHSLVSLEEKWLPDIPIDDETTLVRVLGSKSILLVPENHIAGGFRIGRDDESEKDGEYVLFGQGRHVLDESKYRNIQIQKLDRTIVKIGPLTVLYVREGWIGGALRRNEGTYDIFHSGPPYILHDQDFEDIELVKRSLQPFRLGPYQFVTVTDGQLAGAFTKSGRFQVLPPGNTYQLHEKFFDPAHLVNRTDSFRLGPYFYLTVRKGFVAGATRKKGGEFVVLPPGETYRLNVEEYFEPVHVKRDQHIVRCGPLTFLTVQKGKLSGAYQVSDGKFVEFDDADAEYVLHELEYHSLCTIDKLSTEVQQFGPYYVVTIPEGYCGVFQREGRIEIREPGFYQVPADQYSIGKPIPLKTFTLTFSKLEFKTRDGISMAMNATVVWKVKEPLLTFKFPDGFDAVERNVRERAMNNLTKLCKRYNRGELLPTQQDVVVTGGAVDLSDEEAEELMKQSMEKTKEIYSEFEGTCQETMVDASEQSGWGVTIQKVSLDGFELLDEHIIDDLAKITRSIIATKSEKVKGELAIAQAETEKKANVKRAENDAHISMQRAEAAAKVLRTEARAKGDARVAEAEAENKVKVLLATTEAKADAEARTVRLEIDIRDKKERAEAEAHAMKLLAEAEYDKQMKENEAAKQIPMHRVELEKARIAAEAVANFGQAAWRHPQDMVGFLEQLMPYLRLAPTTTAEEAFKKIRDTQGLFGSSSSSKK